jgi:hypothetical protein
MGEQPMQLQDETRREAQPRFNGLGRGQSRAAPLPKAPTSEEMARRILANSNAKPVQRFDSADYYMNKWLQKRQARLDPNGPRHLAHEHAPRSRLEEQLAGGVTLLPRPLPRQPVQQEDLGQE